jgi:hypothetical protein
VGRFVWLSQGADSFHDSVLRAIVGGVRYQRSWVQYLLSEVCECLTDFIFRSPLGRVFAFPSFFSFPRACLAEMASSCAGVGLVGSNLSPTGAMFGD